MYNMYKESTYIDCKKFVLSLQQKYQFLSPQTQKRGLNLNKSMLLSWWSVYSIPKAVI